ncbi:MAG: hypothetical protein Q8S33_23475 [Myxococcales bacterium]|nr:hypothetical protein [Myxococcales bacterium]MDP3503315.1 hypothetical protein [Myxococcales bacterium]
MKTHLVSLGLVVLLCAGGCSPNVACPFGTGRSVPAALFAVERTTTSVSMSFPAPIRCALPEGTFLATGTFTDVLGQQQPLVIDALAHVQSSGSANVTVSFTATVPGPGQLKLFVDPQLGIVNVPVNVARDGTKLPTVDERSPCPEPQRTRAGHLVCQDAGVTVFRGGQLVGSFPRAAGAQVVGDVLWVQGDADAGPLLSFERFVTRDGGLALSHSGSVGGFRPSSLSFADEQRVSALGTTAITQPDGGLEFVTTQVAVNAETVVSEDDTAWRWVVDRWCAADGGCLPGGARTKLAGVQPEVWWESTAVSLFVHRRPIADAGAFDAVPLAQGASFATRRTHITGARRPLWDDPRQGQFLFEWRADAGGLVLTHFPDHRELWQGRDVIAFSLDGGVVRFYTLSQDD